MPSTIPGHLVCMELRRQGYQAHATLSWIQVAHYPFIAPRAGEFLNLEEIALFRTLKFERRQISYLLGRWAAKYALKACLDSKLEPIDIAIKSGVFNQPVVCCPIARSLGVSISHNDFLVCGLAYPEEHPMAIDVEEVNESRTEVMLTQIGRNEENMAQLVCSTKDVAATVVWTAKEALSKALRCGMTCPYELLEISKLEVGQGYYTGRFKNFGQYKFQTWLRNGTVLTIVLPKNTELDLNIPETL